MCGIVGVVDLDGGDVEPQLVRAMADRIVHRGPDGDGYCTDGPFGLGMRRLSIIDLADGQQPFFNESGSIITVYNGEIYNFEALSDLLRGRGHVLKTRCDTEVIPHLYEDYGADCVEKLTGMFAIAVWDRDRESLFLARDRLGIKPLYYTEHGGRFYFASELKSFESCGVLGDVSPEAVYHYVTYGYVPAPWTIYKGVFKLPPGHRIEVRRGQVTIERYWELTFQPGPPRSEESLLEELEERLREAVRIRLMSDVPLGAFLSGGVDSSLVVALMCQAGGSRVKTFSIAFDESSHDESVYARAVAAKYDTDHTELTVRPDLWTSVEDIVLQFDEPFADSSAIPTYFLSKLTREHVTVAMSGDGGDELFAGYERYTDYVRKRPLYRIPKSVRGPVFGCLGDLLPRGTRGKRFLRSLRLEPFEDYVYGDFEWTHDDLLNEEFRANLSNIDPMGPARVHVSKRVSCELDALCQHDIGLYLPDDILTKVDRTSMAVSLEVRVPMLDHHVAEFAAGLPANMRLRGRTGKYLLKRLLEKFMPPEHVHRQKRGFAIPLGQWFRSELRDELLDTLSPVRIRESGVFNHETVDFAIHQHMSGKRDCKALLWRLFVYQLWDRRRRTRQSVATVPTGAACVNDKTVAGR